MCEEALRLADIGNIKFQEYMHNSYDCFPGLVEDPPDSGRFTHSVYSGPLMFSIDATFRPQYAYELRIAALEHECDRLRNAKK